MADSEENSINWEGFKVVDELSDFEQPRPSEKYAETSHQTRGDKRPRERYLKSRRFPSNNVGRNRKFEPRYKKRFEISRNLKDVSVEDKHAGEEFHLYRKWDKVRNSGRRNMAEKRNGNSSVMLENSFVESRKALRSKLYRKKDHERSNFGSKQILNSLLHQLESLPSPPLRKNATMRKVSCSSNWKNFKRVVIVSDGRIEFDKDIIETKSHYEIQVFNKSQLVLDDLASFAKEKVDFSAPVETLMICSVGSYDLVSLEDAETCQNLSNHKPFKQISLKNPNDKDKDILGKLIQKTKEQKKKLHKLLGSESEVYFTTIDYVSLVKFHENQLKLHDRKSFHELALQLDVNGLLEMEGRLDRVIKSYNKYNLENNLTTLPLDVNAYRKKPVRNDESRSSSSEAGLVLSSDMCLDISHSLVKDVRNFLDIRSRYKKVIFVGDSRLEHVRKAWPSDVRYNCKIMTDSDLTLGNLSNAEDPVMKEICSSRDSLIVISPGMKDLCKLVCNPECKDHKKLEIFVPYSAGSKVKNPDRIVNKMIELSVYMYRILKHIDSLAINCDVLFTFMYDFDLLSYQEYVTHLHQKEENHHIKTPVIDIKEEYLVKLKEVLSIIRFYNVICKSISDRYSFKLRSFPSWIPGKEVGEGNAQEIPRSVLYDGVHPSSSVAAEMAERFKVFADDALKIGAENFRSPNFKVIASIITKASANFIVREIDSNGYTHGAKTSEEYRRKDEHGENDQTVDYRRGTLGSGSFSGSSHISKRRHPEHRSASTKSSKSQCSSNLLDHPLSDVSDVESYDSENFESSVRENHGKDIHHLESVSGTSREKFKHRHLIESSTYYKGNRQLLPVLHKKRFPHSFSTGGRSRSRSLSPPPNSRYYVRPVSYPTQEIHSRTYDLPIGYKNSKMSGKGLYSRSPSVSVKSHPPASHSRSTSPREKSPETIALMSLRDVHNKECEVYRRQPNAHPDYDKEFRMYRDKKMRCIIGIGGDPNTYDITKDWEAYWKTRLEELLEITWVSRRDKCLEMLRQSTSSRNRFPILTKQQPKDFRRKHYKSRSRSSSSERQSRNLEKLSKKGKRNRSLNSSYSPEREVTKGKRNRSLSRSYSPEREVTKQKRNRSLSSSYSPEREVTKQKWNRSRSRSYSLEREVCKRNKTRSRSISREKESRSVSRKMERLIQKEKEFTKKRERKRSRSNSSSAGSEEQSEEGEEFFREQKGKRSRSRSPSTGSERFLQKQKDFMRREGERSRCRSSSEGSECQSEDKRGLSVKLTRDISKRASSRDREIRQKGLSISSLINRRDADHSFESDESTKCRKDKMKFLPAASSLLKTHPTDEVEKNLDISKMICNIKDEELRRLQSLLNNDQVKNLFKINRETSLDVLRKSSLSNFVERELSNELNTREANSDDEMAGESIVSKPRNIAKDSSERLYHSRNINGNSWNDFSEREFIKELKTAEESNDDEMPVENIASKPEDISKDSSELSFLSRNRNCSTSFGQHISKERPFQSQKSVLLPEILEKIGVRCSSTKSDILSVKASSSGKSVLPYASEEESASEVTSTTPSFGPEMQEDLMEVLEILVRLGERLSDLKIPLKVIYEKALLYKSMGTESSKLLHEKDFKSLLNLISNKLNKMLEEEDLNVVQRVIIQEAYERLSNILKASGPDLEISLIAEKCLGRNEADTIAYIQSQFLKNGLHLVSHEQLKAVYANVQSEKSKLLNKILKQSNNTTRNSPSTSMIKDLYTQKEMSFEHELSPHLPFQHNWSSEDSQVNRTMGNPRSLLNKETPSCPKLSSEHKLEFQPKLHLESFLSNRQVEDSLVPKMLDYTYQWDSEDSPREGASDDYLFKGHPEEHHRKMTDISLRREFKGSRQKVKDNLAEAESDEFSSRKSDNEFSSRTSIDFPAERQRNSRRSVSDFGFTSAQEDKEFSTNRELDFPSNRRYKDSPEREVGKYSSEGFMNDLLSGRWFQGSSN